MKASSNTGRVALGGLGLRTFAPLIQLAAGMIASSLQAASVSAPSSEAYENEPFLRFRLERDGDTNLLQRVDYFTQDVTALAGMHYLAVAGTVNFAVGQTTAHVDVPLLDNGLLEGEKNFRLTLTNADPKLIIYPEPHTKVTGCESYQLGIIKDNELPPTLLDSSFAPDFFVWREMPDSRLLAAQDLDIVMLRPNGWVDPSFTPGGGSMDGWYLPTYVFGDGKILARYSPPYRYEWRHVRLFPNGAVDKVFNGLPGEASFWAAEPNGKLLMSHNGRLFRVNSDGSMDGSFREGIFSGGLRAVVVQTDGKLLVGGSFNNFNGVEQCGLVRLNPDGLIDSSFASLTNPVDRVLVRANEKIIVNGQIQLNPDGTTDPSFTPWIPCNIQCELPGGQLLATVWWRVIRLNSDGSLDPSFSSTLAHKCTEAGVTALSVDLTSSGILVGGYFDRIDGFPRSGSKTIRLLTHPPQPEFRVFVPPSACRSAGAVSIKVVRTGDTLAAASLDYSTLDDIAKGGTDYVPQSGTLRFAPLEVSKEITVQLLAPTGIEQRLRFKLAWSNPSKGYTNTAPTSVVIWPDLRLGTEQLLSVGRFRLHGTIPGLYYRLEFSTDLFDWVGGADLRATSSALDIPVGPLGSPVRFFRAAAFR